MAKIGKLGKLNLKWGQVMNIVLVVFVVLGLYYLVYNTNFFGMRTSEGFKGAEKELAKKTASAESDAGDASSTSSSAPPSPELDAGSVDVEADTGPEPEPEPEKEGFHNMLNNMAPYASNPMQPADLPNWFLDSTKFSPGCCPSTYSSSTGCACLSPQQISFLNQRGGNRTCSSQY